MDASKSWWSCIVIPSVLIHVANAPRSSNRRPFDQMSQKFVGVCICYIRHRSFTRVPSVDNNRIFMTFDQRDALKCVSKHDSRRIFFIKLRKYQNIKDRALFAYERYKIPTELSSFTICIILSSTVT